MEYKHVCTILTTHGLKGEVKVYLDTTEIERRFKKNATLYIDDNGRYIEVKVKSFRYSKDNIGYLTFLKYEDINLIEPYLKKEVYGEKLTFTDKIYLSDLLGFKALNSKGEVLGTVDDSCIIANRTYISINSNLVPFIKDVFFTHVDEENKTIELTEKGEDVLKNA